jgi:hypothetical protein
MATIVQNRELPGYIRVATVFDVDGIKPIWFEQIENPAAGRIFIRKVNLVWTHHLGTAKFQSFAVSAADYNNYTLEFDTETLTWCLSLVESTPFP